MFFHITLEKFLSIHPRYLGPNLKRTLEDKLHEEIEGTCSGRYGFIITVTSIDNWGLGQIEETTGFVVFPVKFKAIVFKPFRNEILDAVVTQVSKVGFFADIGPLQVFVSSHSIPPDIKFDPQNNPPCFISDDATVKIEKDSEVRLKIIGIRIDDGIFCIGTIKEDFLGVLS
jgi:DNA-directed RNA polymerase II subunit RPB7